MAGFAHVTAVGRLTDNLEMKTTQSGKVFLPFTIAYDHSKDASTFLRCVAWGKTAEVIEKYHGKGDLIGVQGSLEEDTWDKDGKTYKTFKLQVRSFEFMPNKKENRPLTQNEVLEKSGDFVVTEIEDKPIDLSEIPF